jgi:arabinofuranan 3-O-arabinosyltransferase
MRQAAVPTIVTVVARSFVAAALFVYFFDLLHQTQNGLVNGAGRPFGDDWVNYWSGGFLALHGRAAAVYDLHAFHGFQETIVGSPLDGYHYSYPPVMLLLTAPFALLPYVPGLFVWLSAGWYAFYRVLKREMGQGALLFALASPAVLINAIGGQNGCWTAALFGGGLSLLERRPYLAGGLFGMMIYKPQLTLLVPVALVAGRRWRAIAAASVTAGALLIVSVNFFGIDVWSEYLRNLNALRHTILEDGTGVWHRFVSLFVAARQLGASVEAAYIIQAAFALAACAAVAAVWFKDAPAGLRNAVLLLATCFATPYLQDYDMVFGALVVAWLWQQPVEVYPSERALQVACALFLILPLVAAALAHLTHLAFGPVFTLPVFVLAVRAAFMPRAQLAVVPIPDRA